MDLDSKEVLLDQPFKPDAPAGDTVPEVETKEEVLKEEDSIEKPRVPYSRFENVSRARREAEAEADKWRQRAIELEERKFQSSQPTIEIPTWWTKLYGEGDQQKEAYSIWQQGQQDVVTRAKQEALEEFRSEQAREQEVVKGNLATIDEGLENLSAYVGRELTEKEQSDILDIVDDYTPKGDDGKYLGATLSFDKAWDIYELKQQTAKAPRQKSRDNAANVINTPSSGQPSVEQQERDKNFQPRNWGAWQDRLGKEN